MVNDADDWDEVLVYGSKRLLSANASAWRLTRAPWPSGIWLQRQPRRHGFAVAAPVSFPARRFVVRGLAIIFGDQLPDIGLTVGKVSNLVAFRASEICRHFCTSGGRERIANQRRDRRAG
jgi:hypothetical protein